MNFLKIIAIYDLLFKAGGYDDPLFKSQTFLDRADLVRFDSVSANDYPFNLGEVLSIKVINKILFFYPEMKLGLF